MERSEQGAVSQGDGAPSRVESASASTLGRREDFRIAEKGEKVGPEHIGQFFAYGHLPEHLKEVSKPFAELAERIVVTLPRNPERTVALRKLLEAKDAAVRARLAQ